MRRLNLFLFVFTLLVAGMTLTATAANSSSYSNQTPTETDSVWVKGDALITNASQITANSRVSPHPTCCVPKATATETTNTFGTHRGATLPYLPEAQIHICK